MKSCTYFLLSLLSLSSYGGELSLEREVNRPVTELINKFRPQTPRDCAILAIGGPELMRYSMVSDFLETGVLELSYAKHGLEYADFSIGKFQMKPSFLERLEQSICKDPRLLNQYQSLTSYPSDNIQTVRSERIKRIKSPDFQYLILSAFYDYCQLTYCDYLDHVSMEKVVRFVGTAYNLGFGQTTAGILQYLPKAYFPYGAKYEGDQFAYSSVSAEIFKQLIKSLCKSTYSISSQDCYSGLVKNCP